MLRYLIILLLPLTLFSQTKEKRLALVIGNSNYDKGPLNNPVNDALLMARTLDSLDFDVILDTNIANRGEFLKTIREFGNKRSDYDVAFVYYAGHGIQVGAENFLLPTKVNFETENDVMDFGVSVQNIMRYLTAMTNQVNILVLDACRDNPFEGNWNKTRSLKGGGLAKIPPPTGSLIAFSTDAGNTAADGDGENSVYCRSLCENMKLSEISLDQVFRNVRSDVLKQTDGNQRPVESSQLTGKTYFLNPKDYTLEILEIEKLLQNYKAKEAKTIIDRLNLKNNDLVKCLNLRSLFLLDKISEAELEITNHLTTSKQFSFNFLQVAFDISLYTENLNSNDFIKINNKLYNKVFINEGFYFRKKSKQNPELFNNYKTKINAIKNKKNLSNYEIYNIIEYYNYVNEDVDSIIYYAKKINYDDNISSRLWKALISTFEENYLYTFEMEPENQNNFYELVDQHLELGVLRFPEFFAVYDAIFDWCYLGLEVNKTYKYIDDFYNEESLNELNFKLDKHLKNCDLSIKLGGDKVSTLRTKSNLITNYIILVDNKYSDNIPEYYDTYRKKYLDDAISHLLNSMEVTKDTSLLIELNWSVGNLYTNLSSNHNLAVKYLLQAVDLGGDYYKIYRHIGNAYGSLNIPLLSIEFYKKTISKINSSKFFDQKLKKEELSDAYARIYYQYRGLGNNDDALKAIKKRYELSDKKRGEYDLIETYIHNNILDSAILVSKEHLEESGDLTFLILNSISHFKNNDTILAKKQIMGLFKNKSLNEVIKLSESSLRVYYYLTHFYFVSKDYQNMLNIINDAIELGKVEKWDKDYFSSLYYHKSFALNKIGENVDALIYITKAIEVFEYDIFSTDSTFYKPLNLETINLMKSKIVSSF